MEEELQLRWRTSDSASALHAADAICRGQTLADSALQEALQDVAPRLIRDLPPDYPRDLFLSHVVAQSAGIGSNRDLADVVLRKTLGHAAPPTLRDRLAETITDVESAVAKLSPTLLADLGPACDSMRKRCEPAIRPLLARIGELTDDALIPPAAEIIVVHPARGGGGAAHIPYNSVRIEAVSDDPHPALPESLRLVWLIAQLNQDLPALSATVSSHRLLLLASLALLPATLTAAADRGGARCDADRVELALTAWRVDEDLAEREFTQPLSEAGALLFQWWETYSTSRPKWSVALAGLDRLFS